MYVSLWICSLRSYIPLRIYVKVSAGWLWCPTTWFGDSLERISFVHRTNNSTQCSYIGAVNCWKVVLISHGQTIHLWNRLTVSALMQSRLQRIGFQFHLFLVSFSQIMLLFSSEVSKQLFWKSFSCKVERSTTSTESSNENSNCYSSSSAAKSNFSGRQICSF